MKMSTQHPATVCHIEIPVLKDQQEMTKDFYHQLFGWDIAFDQIPNYGLTTNLEVSVGLPLVDKIAKTTNRIYIEVDNIPATLTQVDKLGGKVMTDKNKISDDIGFGATFTDLSGNTIGLFSPT